MPHIRSPSVYLSSESLYDTYLTSDAEPSPSDDPLFPAWHRARHPESLSDVALCQKLSQWRAYHAFSEQTAAEQLRMLESNPLFQELRRRQRRRKRQRRERRPPQVESESSVSNLSGSVLGEQRHGTDSSVVSGLVCGSWYRKISRDVVLANTTTEDSDEEAVRRSSDTSRTENRTESEYNGPAIAIDPESECDGLAFDSSATSTTVVYPKEELPCTLNEQKKIRKLKPCRHELFACHVTECKFVGTSSSSIREHTIAHTYGELHMCDFPGCQRYYMTSTGMVRHRINHDFPRLCDFPGCGIRCMSPSVLATHRKAHTIEGQIRKKNQENRLLKQLRGWGYTVDVEVTINAKRKDCVRDTENRYFSRLDFVIVECVSRILIVECDEYQHSSYLLPCELSRMADVQAALVLAGYTLPVHWIRYAPNGTYMVGGREQVLRREEREGILKEYLKSLCSGDIKPSGQMSIHYMFYNRSCDEGLPCIVTEPGFPEHLKEFVTFC